MSWDHTMKPILLQIIFFSLIRNFDILLTDVCVMSHSDILLLEHTCTIYNMGPEDSVNKMFVEALLPKAE